MFHLLTRTFVILSLLIGIASLYDDLESAYGAENGVFGDEIKLEGDQEDDSYAAYGDVYAGYDEDYETDQDDHILANVSFSMERLKEFYNCLCLGTFTSCKINYRIEGNNWSVTDIVKNGTFYGENELCKYYVCSYVENSQHISCDQLKEQSTACNVGSAAQFFRFKEHDCCGSTCVGLFWSSPDEQMTFFQNSSDIESCDDTCMCKPDDGNGHTIIKITPPPFSNNTQIDKYIIHKTELPNIGSSRTPSENTQTSSDVSSKLLSHLTSTKNTAVDEPTNDKNTPLVLNENGTQYDPPPSDKNTERKTVLIVIITIIALLFIISCVVFIFVVIRKRKQQSKKLNVNNNTHSTNVAIVNTGPQLSYARFEQTNETAPSQYSTPLIGGVTTTNANVYKQSQNGPGVDKNGVKVLSIQGVGENSINNIPKKTVHGGPEASTRVRVDPGSSRTSANKQKYNDKISDTYPSNSHDGIRDHTHSKKSGQITTGNDIDSGNVKKMLNSNYDESVGFISETGKKGPLRKAANSKTAASSKLSEDEESTQPLLTTPMIKESVV
uniref:WSC domain-containing protein n=1 Tax=Arion vulgaris TaxID=1028688 RepID=A0A0B7BNB0_9EUPU